MPPYPAEPWRKPPSDETAADAADDDGGLPAPPSAADSDKRSDKSHGTRSDKTRGLMLPQVRHLAGRPPPPKVAARPPPHRPRPDPGEISLVVRPPKTTDGCEGACTLPRGVRRTIADLADCMISPMVPGPLYVAGVLGDDQLKGGIAALLGMFQADGSENGDGPLGALEDDGTVDKLWELRLCIEMLRDALESYDLNGPRDSLSTPEETIAAVEETLRRVAELGVVGRVETDASHDADRMEVEVMRSAAFQQGGCLTQCLLSSRLGISGLLEAALGELTSWRARPSDADRSEWKSWDRVYERLALSAGILISRGDSSLLGGEACCKELVSCPAMVVPLCSMMVPARGRMLKESVDAQPPFCSGLFGGGLSNGSARSKGTSGSR